MAHVDVVYIPIDQCPLRSQVVFVAGMTVHHVLEQSGFMERYPDLLSMPIGIFSKMVPLDRLVKPGDRIEIYRSLTRNPMETRRQRAKKS